MPKMLACVVFLLVLGGCGSDTDEPPSSTSGPATTTDPASTVDPATTTDPASTGSDGPVDVSTLMADPKPGFVSVTGFIVWDDTGARLCEVLLESFPPQCGGRSIGFVDPVQLDRELELDEAQGVRWTNQQVVLSGTFDGKQLMLLDQLTEDD